MAASAYFDQVQKLYIACFGRPADPVGLAYWVGLIDPGTVSSAQAAFTILNSAGTTTLTSVIENSSALTGTNITRTTHGGFTWTCDVVNGTSLVVSAVNTDAAGTAVTFRDGADSYLFVVGDSTAGFSNRMR